MADKKEKFARLLSLYKELDFWCREHDIRIFMDYGTLLGAVRHKGFIPWDFDLDVSVCWDDYQKLLTAWDKDPIPGRAIVNVDRYKDYPSVFSRYVDDKTTEIRELSAWDLAPCGMSLDIFPKIPLPRGKRKEQKARDALLVWYEMKIDLKLSKRTHEESMKNLYRKMLKYADRVGKEKALRRLEKIIFSTPESECDRYQAMTAGHRVTQIDEKKYLGNLCELPFEDHMGYAPEHYVEWLENRYGFDWRIYPKSRKEGYEYVEDISIPYPVYVNDYMQFLDKDQIVRDLKELKRLDVKDMFIRGEVSPEYYRAAAEPLIMKLETYDISQAAGFPEDDLPKDLEDLLLQYVKMQLSSKYVYWAVWAGMDDAWLAVTCRLLYKRGEYKTLKKLIDLRESALDKPLPEELCRIREQLFTRYSVYNAMDYGEGNKEAVKKILAEKTEEDGVDEKTRQIAELFLLYPPAEEENADEFCRMASDAALKWPQDWYVKCYQADVFALQGEAERAGQLFSEIEEECDNGMVVLKAKNDRGRYGLVF